MSDVPTPTGEVDHFNLSIYVGPINFTYSGSKDFLKDLPGILAELQKFDISHLANAKGQAQ